MNPFEKVKDSSVWFAPENLAVSHKKDPFIRIGVVSKVIIDEDVGETRYLVEVNDRNDKINAWCKLMTSLGGVYNYEDYTVRGYTANPLALSDKFAGKAGDYVVVAFLNGETREGVILGGLRHPARKSTLDGTDGPAYISEFNGIETSITDEGEWTLTFKGMPLNEPFLELPSTGVPILSPQYNPVISGSFMKFDSEGGWELNDSALALPQSIKIDKAGGTMTLTSGEIELAMDKLSGEVDLTANTFSVDAQLKIEQKTLEFSVEATTSIKLKGLQIAIGSDSVELFDQLIQLIDALGNVAPISPVGNCTPLMGTPQWINVAMIKAKLSVIKGSL